MIQTMKDMISIVLTKNKIKVSCHNHRLSMMTYEMMKAQNSAYTSWGCDGAKIKGCQGPASSGNKEPNEYRYHCAKCSFDFCQKCYDTYGNAHEHTLERLTHTQIKALHPGSYSAWNCDGRNIESTCKKASENKDL